MQLRIFKVRTLLNNAFNLNCDLCQTFSEDINSLGVTFFSQYFYVICMRFLPEICNVCEFVNLST